MNLEQMVTEKPNVFYDGLWPSMQTGDGVMCICYRAPDRECPRESMVSTSSEDGR